MGILLGLTKNHCYRQILLYSNLLHLYFINQTQSPAQMKLPLCLSITFCLFTVKESLISDVLRGLLLLLVKHAHLVLTLITDG